MKSNRFNLDMKFDALLKQVGARGNEIKRGESQDNDNEENDNNEQDDDININN